MEYLGGGGGCEGVRAMIVLLAESDALCLPFNKEMTEELHHQF